ncbi:glutathione S-transferase N-terminal domain-containing protein [Brevundimonas sp. NIBR11]|uniref:glutathione S-transferase family protein n=1 Tax=Brevundimonas sp. NIBR11 TaxID=3015999 RepID=UPI0022F07AF1|nr:glutathione S-transferase N-terminal domain-containing protein [Brevundimonas sp. NIBR11]WGM31630.1 Glutathione S-transferase GST-6.0 [Brevundimonas sp. NIBR11]
MLKLYYSPGACAMASHIALEEAGADYDIVAVDLKKGEQKTPEYLAINPAGSTPALVTNEGVLTENLVIMGYVAQTHPEANLADNDSSFNFGKMQSLNGWLGSSLHPAIGRVLFSRPPLEGQARADQVELALGKFDLAENHLFKGPWAMGAEYTVADGYLSVFTRWARQSGLLDKTRFPRLNDHLDRVQARPAVQRVLAAEGIAPV